MCIYKTKKPFYRIYKKWVEPRNKNYKHFRIKVSGENKGFLKYILDFQIDNILNIFRQF